MTSQLGESMRLQTTAIPRRFPAALADRAIYCPRVVSTGDGCLIVRLNGRIETARLARAVRLTLDAEPILGCRFVDHWYRPYWERCDDLDQREVCRVCETDEVGNTIERCITGSRDPREGPQVEVTVIRGPTDTMCLLFNHMVGDGAALKQCFDLIVNQYRRLRTEPDYTPTPNVHGSRTMAELGRQFTLRHKWNVFRQAVHSARLMNKLQWTFPRPNPGPACRHLSRRIVPPEQVRTIYRFGRQQRATVHMVVMAAYYRALRALAPPLPERAALLLTTVDVRRYLPQRRTEGICNQVGGMALVVDPSHGDSLAEIVAQLSGQIKALMKSRLDVTSGLFCLETTPGVSWLINTIPFAWLIRAGRRRFGKMRKRGGLGVVMVSNGGDLDAELPDFGDVQIDDMFATGATSLMPGFTGIAVTGFRGALNLCTTYDDTCMQGAFVEAVLDRVLQELPGGREEMHS